MPRPQEFGSVGRGSSSVVLPLRRIKAKAAVADPRELVRRPRDDSLIVDVEEIQGLGDGQPKIEHGCPAVPVEHVGWLIRAVEGSHWCTDSNACFARATFSRMAPAEAVQTNGLGLVLCCPR